MVSNVINMFSRVNIYDLREVWVEKKPTVLDEEIASLILEGKENVQNITPEVLYVILKRTNEEEQCSFLENNLKDIEKLLRSFLNKASINDEKNPNLLLYYSSLNFLAQEEGFEPILSKIKFSLSSRLSLSQKITLLKKYISQISVSDFNGLLSELVDFYTPPISEEMLKTVSDFGIVYNYPGPHAKKEEELTFQELSTLIESLRQLNFARMDLKEYLNLQLFAKQKEECIECMKCDYERIEFLINKKRYDCCYAYNNIDVFLEFLDFFKDTLFNEENIDYSVRKLLLPNLSGRMDSIGNFLMKLPKVYQYIVQSEVLWDYTNLFDESNALYESFLALHQNFSIIQTHLLKGNYGKNLSIFEKMETIIRKNKPNEFNFEIETIFSNDYLYLLEYLKENPNETLYEQGYKLLLKDVKPYIKLKEDETVYEEMLTLYYRRLIKGFPLSKLLYFNNEIELLSYQRFNLDIVGIEEFRVKQLNSIPAKQYLKLVKKYYNNTCPSKDHKFGVWYMMNEDFDENVFYLCLLKAFLIFPYEKLIILLEKIEKKSFLRVFEKLVDAIDLKKIDFDNQEFKKYHQKLLRLLFEPKDTAFKEYDENSFLWNNFSLLINHWEQIVNFFKSSSQVRLASILKFLPTILFENVHLKPEYSELNEYLLYIGTSELALKKIDEYYLDMKERYYSYVPQVSGSVGEYTYKMLNASDPFGLAVGKLTHCCYRLDGAAKQSMYYTMLSPKNRIFCVYHNDVLIAQSWVWREGNVVCFDNIEALNKEKENANLWFACYQEATKKMIEQSVKGEPYNEQIKRITLGRHHLDIPISLLESYEIVKKDELILPKNELETIIPKLYLDSKSLQVILYQTPDFDYKRNISYTGTVYCDERSKPTMMNLYQTYDSLQKQLLQQTIRSIDLLSTGNYIERKNIIDGIVMKDWYAIKENETWYHQIFSFDPRAHHEYEEFLETKKLVLK